MRLVFRCKLHSPRYFLRIGRLRIMFWPDSRWYLPEVHWDKQDCPKCERLRSELAEARAALAKDAPIARAAREWRQAKQAYLTTTHSDNWRALVVAMDQGWERLLALIESDAVQQAQEVNPK